MNEFDRLLIEKMKAAVQEKIEALGYELVDIELVPGPKGRAVQIFIDKPGGVTIDDCASVSYLIDRDIEEVMVLEGSYFLEVSSPGLTRKLKNERDFEREIGKLCKVVLKDGRTIKGRINSVSPEHVIVESGDESIEIAFSDIKKANLEYEVK